MGWYLNSCAYGGEQNNSRANYEGDVASLNHFGFDGVKLDGCGKMTNMTLYARLQEASGRPMLVEACHGGDKKDDDNSGVATHDWCP